MKMLRMIQFKILNLRLWIAEFATERAWSPAASMRIDRLVQKIESLRGRAA